MTALSDKKTEWQPSASIKNLLARAKIIADIRQFFTERGLLEVETPVLSEFGVRIFTFPPLIQNLLPLLMNSQKHSGFLQARNIT